MGANIATTPPTISKIVETRFECEISEEIIEHLIRAYLNAPPAADVRFNIGQVFRGATVQWREIANG